MSAVGNVRASGGCGMTVARPVNLWVEPFAGSAAVALALVGGSACIPPIGYMGGKRRDAPDILGAFGLRVGQGADHVVLVDAGPWGEAWEVIFDAELRAELVTILRSWGRPDPSQLWRDLRDAGRPDDLVERVAAWLWLQGRSASCTPVWWEQDDTPGPREPLPGLTGSACESGANRLVMSGAGALGPSGKRWAVDSVRDATQGHQGGLVMPGNGSKGPALIDAHEKAGSRLVMADKPGKRPQAAQAARTRQPKSKGEAHKHRDGGGGIVRPGTVADRIEAIGRAPWREVTVLRSHAELEAIDLDGAMLYADPPYQGCTRYAAVCPRDEVLRLATTWRDRGAHVVVSEAEALPLEGWHAYEIRRREWLTCSEPPVRRPAVQLSLWRAA